MKIRTDFVTNSSSSSFILKEINQEQMEKALERRLSVPPRNEWEAEDYEWVKHIIPYMTGKRFKEYGMRELLEVYHWYRDEILSDLLGIESWKNSCTGDTGKRLAAMFILDIYEKHLWETGMWEPVSFEFLNTEVWEYMASWDAEDHTLKEFYLSHIEKLMAYASEFDGKLFPEVMEYLFDAQYLYYSEMETHYLICEALKDAGICLYCCGHMG